MKNIYKKIRKATQKEISHMYLIRLIAEPIWYIHYIDGSYIQGSGTIGACYFDEKNSGTFIKEHPDYERILIKDAPKEHNPNLDRMNN